MIVSTDLDNNYFGLVVLDASDGKVVPVFMWNRGQFSVIV
jgi:type IV secretory pathway protease TraF